MPLIPIIAGAGGIVTTWENGPAQGGGRIIAAGDKRVHAGRAGTSQPVQVTRRARHEGVERCPELRAIMILLHQDFVLGAGNDQMAPREQIAPKTSIAGVDTTSSRPAATISIGWRILAGIRRLCELVHLSQAASAQATVGAPSAKLGLCLQHRGVARVAHRIGRQHVADEIRCP